MADYWDNTEIFIVQKKQTEFSIDVYSDSKDFFFTMYDEALGALTGVTLTENEAEALANVIKQELEDRFNKATEHY